MQSNSHLASTNHILTFILLCSLGLTAGDYDTSHHGPISDAPLEYLQSKDPLQGFTFLILVSEDLVSENGTFSFQWLWELDHATTIVILAPLQWEEVFGQLQNDLDPETIVEEGDQNGGDGDQPPVVIPNGG